ncbi:Pumilio domain member 9 [Monascus purpureus]|uniref:Pumilio domain member 9 n=1 Tax=Monascus purpureus TaxID=5098 RepID=A0A507QNX1_MONPU|nr:Pumilio domain member 9 [Monascus purpureus]
MEKILARLSPRAPLSGTRACADQDILTKLSEQQSLLEEQKRLLVHNNTAPGTNVEVGESPDISIFPATESLVTTGGARCESGTVETSELLRLKRELHAANSKIALQEQELAQTRVIKHTLDQALGPPSETDLGGQEVTEQTISNLQNVFNASSYAFNQYQDSWNGQEDEQSDTSEALSGAAYNSARGFWAPSAHPALGNAFTADKPFCESLPLASSSVGQESSRFWTGSAQNTGFPSHVPLQSHQILSSPSPGTCSLEPRFSGDQPQFLQGPGLGPRRQISQVNRTGSCFPIQNPPWGTFSTGPLTHPIPRAPPANRQYGAFQQLGMYPVPSCHPRHIGSPLSPTATEFTSANSSVTSWGASSACGNALQTYLSPFEPLNYRRLLDKNVSCDWKYIVDKIVCSNDQQASIFLQQKLKVGTAEQKYDIIEAIVNQAYPLMVNRFGNFLVQRCFEHGTPEQIVAIANAIRGNTLILSMDPFGCHVVQKAFDCVPEEHKAIMVHELLRRIPETVIHRYACHVWQKLFELRWSGEPPQIMAKVNDALRGMWHEVALGETGSLVVQNIFENCVEDEKSRATEHILHWAVDYSMDQFASKIVEKCLKIGGSEFLDRYLARVCVGRADRPRMPLIDIAGDQYENTWFPYVAQNSDHEWQCCAAIHPILLAPVLELQASQLAASIA